MSDGRGSPFLFSLVSMLITLNYHNTHLNNHYNKGRQCDPNGPAVGLSKRYPTQQPGRILVPRASGARKLSRCKEGMAHFLPSRYKVC